MKSDKALLFILAIGFAIVMFGGRSNYKTNGFTRVKIGFGYPGHTIKNMEGSAAECATACGADNNCIGFTRNPETRTCWLKSNLRNEKPIEKRRLFVRDFFSGLAEV